ncbi:MAG: recombinase family protein, partial [Chloroflexota bacterium]|nr:recombinase family protein [Chloroflexota bacterium]
SLIKLVDRLNRLGIPRPSDGRRWHISFVAGMLRNETYTGTLWQNRWRREMVAGKPGQKPKRRVYQRPREEQICTPVPAIIPKETFNIVQTRLVENKRWAGRNTKREYLLSGLLKHACGSAMGARTSHGTPYYYCLKSNRFKAPIDEKGEPQPCPCTWVNGRAMETAVWDTVTGLLRHPDLLMQELERLTQPDSTTREALEEELAQVKKRLEELPKEERRLVEGYRKGFYVDFMMREEMDRVRSEQTSAEERRRELERQLAHLDRALSYKGQVEQLASRLSEGLDQMGFVERRELLRLLVDEVVYDEGQVTIKTIIPLGGNDERRLRPVPQGGQGDGRKGFSSPS